MRDNLFYLNSSTITVVSIVSIVPVALVPIPVPISIVVVVVVPIVIYACHPPGEQNLSKRELESESSLLKHIPFLFEPIAIIRALRTKKSELKEQQLS